MEESRAGIRPALARGFQRPETANNLLGRHIGVEIGKCLIESELKSVLLDRSVHDCRPG
jgi:hypothetical protein